MHGVVYNKQRLIRKLHLFFSRPYSDFTSKNTVCILMCFTPIVLTQCVTVKQSVYTLC